MMDHDHSNFNMKYHDHTSLKMKDHDHSSHIANYRSLEWYELCLNNITDAHSGVLWGPMWTAYQVVVPILVVLGVIGNVLCIVVLAKPHVRALHVNRYFLFMTVMDLLSCLFMIPIALTISGCVFCSRSLAYYYAYLGWAVPEILQIISFCVIVFLSYDRCLAIYLPEHFKENQNHRVFRNRIIFIVTFSIILHIPIIALGKVEVKNGTFVVRDGYRSDFDNSLYKSLFKIYSAFKEVLDYVVPSVVQMVFHLALVIAMVKMKFMNEDEQMERKKFVLNVTIITMGFFYLVTSMPVCIYNFFFAEPKDDCCHGDKGVEIFRGIANCLKLSQNVLNIVFIVILNQTFKKEFFMLLPSSCCLSEDESPILNEDSGQTPKKYTTDNFGYKRDSVNISPSSTNSHYEEPPGRTSYLHNSYLSSLKEVPENIQSYQQSR